jgi:hypothetical protein
MLKYAYKNVPSEYFSLNKYRHVQLNETKRITVEKLRYLRQLENKQTCADIRQKGKSSGLGREKELENDKNIFY